MKKQNRVYEFLQASGVLENGTTEEIQLAKKQYWAGVRKEYKQNRRHQQKSYTVFFTTTELKTITPKANRFRNVTSYIKQATLAQAKEQCIIDKKTVGEIRQAVALHYSTIQQLQEDNILPTQFADEVLEEITGIEKMILQYLL
jgi:hypothetical protein